MSDAEMTGNSGENEEFNPTQPDLGHPSLAGSIDPNSIEGVFLRAVQLKDPCERSEFLDAQCADKHARRRVTALLLAYDDAGSFLETPAAGSRPGEEVRLDFLAPCEDDDCLGIIGPYRVLEVIGSGGMGIVLRAMDPKLNRVVAVKVLLPELARNPNARRRFLREAQAAAAISHPHVVTIHAVEEAQPEAAPPRPPFLVMECVVGQSLQQKLDSAGTLHLAETLRISRQIGEGLAAAHQQGLIHRDIKPANILLENGVQRVKITDFGLARATDDLSVTMTGEVSGTPQYMSPEQATGQRIDHRSDLFSLGCVMYAMCTGHSPFRAKSLAHVIQRVTQDQPRRIAQQNPEVPNWLEQIIRCLLEKSPEHRIQSAEGLVAILDQHLSRLQQPAQSGSHSMINLGLPTTSELPVETIPSTAQQNAATREPPQSQTSMRTQSHTFGSFALTLLAALMLGGAISFATISARVIRDDMQRVEATLIFSLIGTALGIAIASVAIFLKHGTSSITKLRILQTALLLGTIDAGYVWGTFIRSPAASVHDYQALGFLTLLWAAFCVYVGKVWTESEQIEPDWQPLESIHGRVGRCLIWGGYFFTMLPLALIAVGLVLSDGDLMQAGGQFLIVALIFSVLAMAAGYVLRYIVDTMPQSHRPVGIWFATLLAIGTALAGGLLHAIIEQRVQHAVITDRIVAPVPATPTVILTHPDWKIRVLSVNGAGSSLASISPTQTRLMLNPATLGTRISIYIISEDGREFVRYGFPIEKSVSLLKITDDDLSIHNRALVEVIEDAPGVKLRMVKYPTQKVTKNEFSINEAPFHKAMEPGEHRIVLDFVREEWDLPEDQLQYQTLDYRVRVPDTNPIKLSLREILQQHGDEAKTHRMKWNPDFKPLSRAAENNVTELKIPSEIKADADTMKADGLASDAQEAETPEAETPAPSIE